MPPPLQTEGLRQADQDIRHSLGRLVGSPLSDDDWRLASIGVAQGGLGARSALEHAPAAYISSLAQTQELCTRIWPGFGEYDLDGGLMRSDVESSLGASFFLPNAGICHSSGTPSQKSLSAKVDAKVCHHLLDPSSHDRHRVAHLSLLRIPGAGVWLFAIPVSLESCIPAPLFRVSSRRRLRMPIWTQDTSCTLCGQAMDQWGDHALVCGCGGDRVTRHNLVRDVVHSAANNQARLGAVLEKPGLLLPHDPSLDDRPPGPDHPRSLFVAGLTSGSLGAPAVVRRPEISPSPAVCASVPLFLIRLLFRPSSPRLNPEKGLSWTLRVSVLRWAFSLSALVIEAVGGGWSDSLRAVVAWIASESNRCSPVRHSDASFKIAQRVSCTLHRENARQSDLDAGS